MAAPAPESRCPRCPARLVRIHGGLLDGVLTCQGGCDLREEHWPPGGLFLVELWFTVERRRNLRRLVAEKKRRGLPLAVSIEEASRAWNGPVPLPGAVPATRLRGLHIED
jgi:hypothetical protein